jgi:D-3-phosphoglycerate dehydrogenase / 2-oxoglutarate reductase
MLFINNSDTPGFIGALGMKLGGAGINIATFNLGRMGEGEDAIALVGIDQAIPAALNEELKALPQVRYVKQLSF